MLKNKKGFSVVEVLIIFVVIGVISGAGWYVYKSNKDKEPSNDTKRTSSPAEKKEKDSTQEEEYQPPEGWVLYEGNALGISFYHPPSWDKDGFKVQSYDQNEAILSGFGTPDSVVFDSATKTWGRYINYGTEHQESISSEGEFGVKTISLPDSEYPFAYIKMGHASVTMYDIYAIHAGKAFRIRLPEINSFDAPDTWQSLVAEQEAAMTDIIKSIKFSD